MKTATIIFVALTVFSGLFLESSSAPNLLQDIVAGVGSQISRGDVLGGLLKDVLDTAGNLVAKIKNLLTGTLVKPQIKEKVEGLYENLKTLLIKLCAAINNRDLGDILEKVKLVNEALKNFEIVIAELLKKYGDDPSIKSYLNTFLKEVKIIVTKLAKLIEPLIKDVIDKIEKGLLPKLEKLIADLIKALNEALPGASGDVKELINNILAVLKKFTQNLHEIIKALLDRITTETLHKVERLFADCKSNIDELKQLCEHADLADAHKNILTELNKLANVILCKFEDVFKIWKNPLLTGLGKICQEVKALVDGVLGELSAETTELIEPLKKLSDLACKLLIAVENGDIVEVQNLEVLICKVVKIIKAVIAKLGEVLGDDAKEKLLQVIEIIVQKLLKELKPILNKLVNGVKNLFSKLIKNLPDILKKINEAIADAKGEFKELLIQIKGLLKDLLEKILDLIKAVLALVSNVTNESQNKVDAIVKEINDILSNIKVLSDSEIGEDIRKVLVEAVGKLYDLLVLVEVIGKCLAF